MNDKENLNTLHDFKIGFIGAGNMTNSIVTGLVESGYPADLIMASNPSPSKLMDLTARLKITTSADNNEVAEFADVLVLAVKPQIMEKVLAQLDPESITQDTVVMSIAAGIRVNRLSEMLPQATKWVRCMPNTPSSVGLGMAGLFENGELNANERLTCENLMRAVGETLWVDQESKIDGVIAAAGSAPAYFFLFLEAMQKETVKMGFNADEARLLVQQAMLGAAKMVTEYPNIELHTLRENVTSKGGTTAQAVKTFNDGELHDLVSKAMQAAVKRAQEMSTQI